MTLETIKAIERYGITAILVIAVIWMNNKVTEMDSKVTSIEMKLYDCLENRIEDQYKRFTPIAGGGKNRLYAVLPEEIKIKKQ